MNHPQQPVPAHGASRKHRLLPFLAACGIAINISFLPVLPAGAVERSEIHQDDLQKAASLVHHGQYQKAYRQFLSLANRGCPTSQCIVGLMHQHGVGVAKDAQQAATWFEKSASQDYAQAQLELGKLYLSGNGVARNTTRAEYWLHRAAMHGLAEAQYQLGKYYVENGGPRMVWQARQLLQSAMKNGYNDASALIAKLPQIPNQSAGATSPVQTGIQNIEQSWQGYGGLSKELGALDKTASRAQ